MTVVTEGFEGVANAATVTTSNTVSTLVTIGTSSAVIGDTAQAAHGTTSMKVTTGATTGETDAEFQLGGTVTQAWARTYLRFSALPSATVRVLRLLNGTASTCLNVRLTATGVVQIADTANGANNASSTTTLAANTWYRLEMRVANSTSVGVGEVKIFTSVDSATPAETVTSAASWNTSAACDRVRFGNAAGTANWGPFWYDDVGISDVGYMGPSVVAGLPELVMAPMTG